MTPIKIFHYKSEHIFEIVLEKMLEQNGLADPLQYYEFDHGFEHQKHNGIDLFERIFNYDVIIIPLSLPNFMSIRIAECIHLIKSNKVLILSSGTEVSPKILTKLFDYFFPSGSIGFAKLLLDIIPNGIQPQKRITDHKLLRKVIDEVISNASCFRKDRGFESPFHKSSITYSNIEDYDKAQLPESKNGSKMTHDQFLNYCTAQLEKGDVEGLLLALDEKVKAGSNRTGHQNEFWYQLLGIKLRLKTIKEDFLNGLIEYEVKLREETKSINYLIELIKSSEPSSNNQ